MGSSVNIMLKECIAIDIAIHKSKVEYVSVVIHLLLVITVWLKFTVICMSNIKLI